jgi:hypothetical protein
MSVPSNLVTTATSVGNREDLSDIIHRVAPEKTPFLSNIGKAKAKARYHEWQTEDLATPDAANAQLEGDDVGTLDASATTARVANYCQIFRKTGGVSRTQDIVDKAGRDSELARQKTLKGIELRRDMEKRFIGNFASNNESGSTPRRSAGLLSWLTSNVSRGTGGANGGFASGIVSAATNGTQRTWTETLLKSVIATAFTNGAAPSQIYMGPAHKQQFSAFTGIAQIRKDAGKAQATIVAGAEIYVSDFGELVAIPHPYGLTRDAPLVDPEMVAVAMLDGYKTQTLAKTGDNERFMLTAEACLEVRNEKAHAVAADLT